MPTSGSRSAEMLVDTSVAVALMVGDHARHESTSAALAGRRLGLAGHAAFETFSVLTRLPPPSRRTPASVSHALAVSFPHTRYLGARRAAELLSDLAALRIAGGAVYDALVGAAAAEHDLVLVTGDRRAVDTYRAVGARPQLLP